MIGKRVPGRHLSQLQPNSQPQNIAEQGALKVKGCASCTAAVRVCKDGLSKLLVGLLGPSNAAKLCPLTVKQVVLKEAWLGMFGVCTFTPNGWNPFKSLAPKPVPALRSAPGSCDALTPPLALAAGGTACPSARLGPV